MNDVVYLDVRTTAEWEDSHKEGAIHIPLDLLERGVLPEVPFDTPLRVYCRSGERAGKAVEILKGAGFYDVENVGGLLDII